MEGPIIDHCCVKAEVNNDQTTPPTAMAAMAGSERTRSSNVIARSVQAPQLQTFPTGAKLWTMNVDWLPRREKALLGRSAKSLADWAITLIGSLPALP
jgi:hypothetical protein